MNTKHLITTKQAATAHRINILNTLNDALLWHNDNQIYKFIYIKRRIVEKRQFLVKLKWRLN